MDPSTWPLWVKVLAGWGPLGAWAGIMTWAYLKLSDRHRAAFETQAKKFADVIAAQARTHQDEKAALNAKHEGQLAELTSTVVKQGQFFAQEARTMDVEHHAQEAELVDRLVGAVEKQGDIAGRVVTAIESMKRHGGGDDGSTR